MVVKSVPVYRDPEHSILGFVTSFDPSSLESGDFMSTIAPTQKQAVQKRTTCNRDCPDTCGMIATIENGRVTRLQGDPEHPVTKGFLCHRTSRFLDRQYHPERLTTPLARRGDSFGPQLGFNVRPFRAG